MNVDPFVYSRNGLALFVQADSEDSSSTVVCGDECGVHGIIEWLQVLLWRLRYFCMDFFLNIE